MKNTLVFEKLITGMQKFASQRHLIAIRDGIVINIIPSIIGSIFLLLVAIPIPGWSEFLASNGWDKILLLPVSSTLDLMGIIAVITIAYRLSESYAVDPLIGAVVSLLCFFQLTPYQIQVADLVDPVSNVLPIMWLGSKGLFTAILVAIVSVEIYRRAMQSKFKITLPESVPPAVLKSFLAIIPAGVTLVLFWILRVMIDFSPFDNIHTVLGEFVSAPLTNMTGTIWGALVMVFLIQFFWFFGIHGGSIILSVMEPLLFLLQDQNRLAFQAGEPLPNILTRWWADVYVFLGGSGATLAAVVPLLFYAKSQHLKKVGRLAVVPTVFSINEPFTFGLPVVFNPLVLIPWICTPLVNVIIAYNATLIGFLPRHNGISIPWTTPMIISGFLLGGWQGVVIQVINFVVSAFIWYFFIKRMDQIEYQKELDSLHTISKKQ
ncbi:MAG: PTS sugar transporter subunit IIC [Brevinema sp.]